MWYYLASALLLAAHDASSQTLKFDWRWWSEDGICALRQQLDNQGSVFAVARTPGADLTAITVIDQSAEASSWKPLRAVSVRLGTGGETIANGFLGPGKTPHSRTVSLSIVEGAFPDQLSRASSLVLSHAKVGTVRIEIRSAAAAIAALRECEDRNMSDWGIDPIAWHALPVKPVPITSQSDWISTSDYPYRSAIYKNDAIVVARLDIAANGTVQGCSVVNRQAPDEFKQAVCAAFKKRARLQPARNARGEGISAPFVVQVRFTAFGL